MRTDKLRTVLHRRFSRLFLRTVLSTLLSAGGHALAQGEVIVEFGFAGEIVANAWNPLRVSLRDGSAAELVLEIDQGNLREGAQWVRYRAPLAGGSGMVVFEDDLFIPAWRSFTWKVRTPERVLASGSLERREVDARPLQLVLARELGTLRALFGPEARVVDLFNAPLPERAGAYDGVATLLVGDADLPPRPQALAAAAAAGSTVLLLEPLPPVYDPLLSLAPTPQQRLGAGRLVRAGEGAARARLNLPSLDREALVAALAIPELSRAPAHLPQLTLLLGLSLYALVATFLLRFGRLPGLLSTLLLALAVGFGAWNVLRPPEALLTRSRSLTLAAGGLAERLELRTLFSLPAQEVTVDGATRPLDADTRSVNARSLNTRSLNTWSLTPTALRLRLPRWSSVTLAAKPELTAALFSWAGEELVNGSDEALGEVFVLGLGQQPPLGPGEAQRPRMHDSLPPELYRPLLPLLPQGSALARSGGSIYVALPETGP